MPSRRRPIYLGDEVTAAGFRLAGVDARSPGAEDLLEEFRRALEECDLLLLSVEFARRLPPPMVREAQARLTPALLVVPDIRRRFAMRELEQRLGRELGVQI